MSERPGDAFRADLDREMQDPQFRAAFEREAARIRRTAQAGAANRLVSFPARYGWPAAVGFLLIPLLAVSFLLAELGHGRVRLTAVVGYLASAAGFFVCLVLMERGRARRERPAVEVEGDD